MTHYIAIEGVIGIGKTTLARLLKPFFDAQVLLEVFEENPFLANFYTDRERYAFQTQLFFLLSRYQQQRQAVPAALQVSNLISDYTFAKDELFAWLNLKDDELAMYGRVHSALGEKIQPPDLLVYLYADHEAVMERIAQRDRPYERDMDPEYIRQLAAAYDAWLANLTDIPVLRLDMTRRNVLSNEDDLHDTVARIQAALTERIPEAPADPAGMEGPRETGVPAIRSLPHYQDFHRHLEGGTTPDPQLLLDLMALTSRVGELGGLLTRAWSLRTDLLQKGRVGEAALHDALQVERATAGEGLAEILALTFQIANAFDLDLEKSYVARMQEKIAGKW